MNLNQLRYFNAVVKFGSFRRASQELNISQPALSNSIRTLEELLGVELLDRGAKLVSPTPYGAVIETFFASALLSVERAKHEIELMKMGSRGHVTIGAPSGLMSELVPEIIAEVRKEKPDYTFSVQISYLDQLIDQLREGHIDVLITTYWPEIGMAEDLTIEGFAEVGVSIYCRPEHPLATKKGIELKDLSSSEWILPNSPVTRGFIKEIFGESHLSTVKQPITSDFIPFIYASMLKLDLLGIIPDFFVRDLVDCGKLVALDYHPTAKTMRVGMIYCAERLRTPAMFKLVNVARSVSQRRLEDLT